MTACSFASQIYARIGTLWCLCDASHVYAMHVCDASHEYAMHASRVYAMPLMCMRCMPLTSMQSLSCLSCPPPWCSVRNTALSPKTSAITQEVPRLCHDAPQDQPPRHIPIYIYLRMYHDMPSYPPPQTYLQRPTQEACNRRGELITIVY